MALSRRQLIAYVALAAVVVAVGVRYVVLPRTAGPARRRRDGPRALGISLRAAGGGRGSPRRRRRRIVVVYVCGAVRSPGVVRVPAGARVADALAARRRRDAPRRSSTA